MYSTNLSHRQLVPMCANLSLTASWYKYEQSLSHSKLVQVEAGTNVYKSLPHVSWYKYIQYKYLSLTGSWNQYVQISLLDGCTYTHRSILVDGCTYTHRNILADDCTYIHRSILVDGCTYSILIGIIS